MSCVVRSTIATVSIFNAAITWSRTASTVAPARNTSRSSVNHFSPVKPVNSAPIASARCSSLFAPSSAPSIILVMGSPWFVVVVRLIPAAGSAPTETKETSIGVQRSAVKVPSLAGSLQRVM